ncbi:hypothetical protein VTL71DRAFT_7849 [Oculimacula yallundae]|uniref:Uncharacterized protein n=1 Tax=Oculimacula yallundae TaxID=86028 RepID=A0ABR4CY64_9HELO
MSSRRHPTNDFLKCKEPLPNPIQFFNAETTPKEGNPMQTFSLTLASSPYAASVECVEVFPQFEDFRRVECDPRGRLLDM